ACSGLHSASTPAHTTISLSSLPSAPRHLRARLLRSVLRLLRAPLPSTAPARIHRSATPLAAASLPHTSHPTSPQLRAPTARPNSSLSPAPLLHLAHHAARATCSTPLHPAPAPLPSLHSANSLPAPPPTTLPHRSSTLPPPRATTALAPASAGPSTR